MAWSYRRRLKIIPGVHLNFSKKGISTTIGVRGASMTFGKSGTYANTSIPGLGLYNRQKISSNEPNENYPERYDPVVSGIEDNIFSADIQEITSQNMQGVKDAILSAHEQRKHLNSDLTKIRLTVGYSKLKLISSYVLLYGLIRKSIPEKIKANILLQKEAISHVLEQLENCFVGLDIEFDEIIKKAYDNVVSSFNDLTTSHKIWDVTSAQFEDTRITRSAAGTLVKKREVKFGLKSIPDIKANFEALWLSNANGADLYIYPSFIVLYSTKTRFAIIGLEEVEFFHSYTRFVETGSIPKDTKIIDHTWSKVNKNGSPDRRFKGNFQIPVVRYGEISLKTETGLNEQYEFSNYEFTNAFGRAFKEYQNIITGLRQLN